MKCDELKPLVFSIRDLAYVDELAVRKNFDNLHDHGKQADRQNGILTTNKGKQHERI